MTRTRAIASNTYGDPDRTAANVLWLVWLLMSYFHLLTPFKNEQMETHLWRPPKAFCHSSLLGRFLYIETGNK